MNSWDLRKRGNLLFALLILICVIEIHSCRNDLSLIVHERKISKRIKDGLFNVKYPELKYSGTNSRKVCDSINSNIKSFVNSLVKEMDCNENCEFKLERKSCGRELKIDYNLDVFDKDYISARFTIYSYQGGAHGRTYYKCFNFSVQRAEQLKLNDLLYLKQKKELQVLNKLLVKYFENPDQCFSEIPSVTPDFEFFSYQNDGFIFSFSDSSLGDYVCGPAEIKIPLWELKQNGLLRL